MEITAAELRFLWMVTAVAALATPWPDTLGEWAVMLALLAPSFWLLSSPARAARIASALTEALGVRPPRIAGIMTAGLLAVLAWIFSVSAAATLGALLLTAITLAALRRGPAGVRGALATSITAGVVGVLSGWAVDALLDGPFAARVGAPSARRLVAEELARDREANFFGLRSPYERVAPEPPHPRILALGDSYTLGQSVSARETWPAQLERLLRKANPRDSVQVINTGQAGWTTANEAELLRRFGWQWAPDLVVVQFTLNDVKESTSGFKHARDLRVSMLPERFRTGPIRNSALLFLLEVQLTLWLDPRWADVDPRRYHPDSLAWRQTEAALREIGDSAAVRRVPVVLMIYPSFPVGEWTAASHPHRPLMDQVAETARRAGMEVLDLTASFAAEGGDWRRWWASPYDQHPNAAAQALAARALAARIGERGYLSPDSF